MQLIEQYPTIIFIAFYDENTHPFEFIAISALWIKSVLTFHKIMNVTPSSL